MTLFGTEPPPDSFLYKAFVVRFRSFFWMTVEPYACICARWKEASASGHEASLCLQNYVSSLVLTERAGFSSLGCVSSLVLMERAGLASLNCLTPTAISFSFPL